MPLPPCSVVSLAALCLALSAARAAAQASTARDSVTITPGAQ